MADQFLTKSRIRFEDCLEAGGGLVLERYPALNAALVAHLGPEAAELFAEPLISRGNDKAAPTVSWYTDAKGDGVPSTSLDETAQAALAASLSRQLRGIRELIDDPDDGPLVSAALHVLGPGDVWSVGGRPVLINWGMLPAEVGRDLKSRTAHYERTLDRYLPLGAAPPLSDAERHARSDRAPARPSAVEPAGASALATPDPVPAPYPVPVVAPVAAAAPEGDARRMPVVAWLPLVLLLALAGATLAWLLVPGNRIFPATRAEGAVPDAAAVELAEGVNQALQERLAGLQQSLVGAQCRDDGTLVMPDGLTIEGQLAPDPGNPDDAPGTVGAASPTPTLPPDPARVMLPASGGESPQTLLALLEAQTALVIANSAAGTATGTGFFVGPDLLVTNFHVVEGADGADGSVFVTNGALGKVLPAKITKTQGPMDTAGADFALLKVEGIARPAFAIYEGTGSLKLQSVIAAGYPGDLLQSDAEFQALVAGDSAAVPDLIVTDGMINTERQLSENTHVVVHSAPISTGNSGGPLVDMCGRIVGVNTFVQQGPLRNLSFALASRDLLAFLQDSGANSMVVRQPCQPEIRRPDAPPAVADAAATPATPPAPETGAAPSP